MLPKKCQVVHMPPIYPVKCHFILFFAYFYCCSSTLVSIFTLPWSPTPTISASHPRTYPLWLFPCVLCTYSLMDLSLFPPIIPLPSGYCQFALHFNVSGYILLACFVYFLVTQLGIFKISHNLSSIFVFLAGKNHKNVY